MSMADKFKAMGEKAKALYHEAKGDVQEAKADVDDALEKAKVQAAEEKGRVEGRADEIHRDAS